MIFSVFKVFVIKVCWKRTHFLTKKKSFNVCVCVYFTFISSVFTPEQCFKEMIRKQEQKTRTEKKDGGGGIWFWQTIHFSINEIFVGLINISIALLMSCNVIMLTILLGVFQVIVNVLKD